MSFMARLKGGAMKVDENPIPPWERDDNNDKKAVAKPSIEILADEQELPPQAVTPMVKKQDEPSGEAVAKSIQQMMTNPNWVVMAEGPVITGECFVTRDGQLYKKVVTIAIQFAAVELKPVIQK